MTATIHAYTKEQIILVDPEDKEIGVIEKVRAHEYAMLHRAFSVFVFRKRKNKIELLLQQRSPKKYHGGKLWTNTCCSHPHPGENLQISAETRLKDEMGIKSDLIEVGKFHYVAQFENGLTENEIDHVFIGDCQTDKILVNPHEVKDYRWVPVPSLMRDLKSNPRKYTPWLMQALEIAMQQIKILSL